MRFALFSAISVLCATIAMAQNDSSITPQAQQVIKFMSERKHAYERGDASAWGRHVAEQCLFVEAGGRVSSKDQFLAGMEPFVGYTFSAVVDRVRTVAFGDTIVVIYREKDIRDFGVQRSEGTYIDTDTYARLNHEWELISWTENLLPPEPPIVKLAPQIYDKYVGRYEVNPKATFTVTRDGNKLMGQYSGEQKFELLPASRSDFFTHGDSAVYEFVWDKSGRVVGHIYRTEGVEVKYTKR